jgi:diguanylate cyclase (GGDEF)-like protein
MLDWRSARDAPSDPGSDAARMLVDAWFASLDVLLAVDRSEEGFSRLFDTLQPLFAFDRAAVLEAEGDHVSCIAAVPADRCGGRFERERLDAVIRGRIAVAGRARDTDIWARFPTELAPPGAPALCFPIGVLDRHAALLLVRAEGAEPFSGGLVALARQSAVIALAALAARQSGRYERELHRLSTGIDEARKNEQRALQDCALLKDIIERFPIGLGVQDEHGLYLLANTAMSAAVDLDRAPSPLQCEPTIPSAPQHVAPDVCEVAEERVEGPAGERTFLTTRTVVNLSGRNLMLSSRYDITDRKQVEAELTRRANFDELTGLPNRLLIQKHVDELIGRQGADTSFALVFVDLDNFKQINDFYSHSIGDALLVKVAQRIKNRLRPSDMLARASGDEFLLVLEPGAGDQVHAIIEQLLADLKQPFQIDAFEMFTSASIGISLYPQHGGDYESLRRNADNAMYHAKSGTKGDAIFFDVEMGRQITNRMQHEQRLRLAIRDKRFCCAFQPKVDIQNQEVVGFETLVRWRDDDGEFHAPGTFIGLAIELGLIDPITHFVLSESLESIERLDAAFGDNTSISINVAARQANDLGFMHAFIQTIKDSNLASRLMLELTEDAFVSDGAFQSRILPLLRELGVRVSIDDFGTGYSSLSVLSEITADELKIDRSFITQIHERPRSQCILKAIESLGHALGMSIVAEGVESFEELAYLHAATHIRFAQGFYFSKPFFLEDVTGTRRITPDGRAHAVTREQLDGRGSRPARVSRRKA